MSIVRRIIMIATIALLVGAVLLIFGVIHINPELPEPIIGIVGAISSVLVFLTTLGADVQARSRYPEPEDPPETTAVIHPRPLDKFEKTKDVVEQAEDYVRRHTDRIRIEIESDDDDE